MNIEEEIKESAFRSPYQRVVVNLLFTANWMQGKLLTFFKDYDITPQQFNILRILRGQYPNKISGVEIKARMLDKNSDIPRLLDRLVKKGYIQKTQCPNDRRAGEISITEKGLELLAQLDKPFHQMERESVGLTEEEANTLSQLLDKWRS